MAASPASRIYIIMLHTLQNSIVVSAIHTDLFYFNLSSEALFTAVTTYRMVYGIGIINCSAKYILQSVAALLSLTILNDLP